MNGLMWFNIRVRLIKLYLIGIRHLHQLGQIVCQQCPRGFQWSSTVLQRLPPGGHFSMIAVAE